MVPEFQFVGLATQSDPGQLMPKADPKMG